MAIRNQFICFLIGEGTLPIQCAELLLEQEHQIKGVISPDTSVSRWTHAKEIPKLCVRASFYFVHLYSDRTPQLLNIY